MLWHLIVSLGMLSVLQYFCCDFIAVQVPLPHGALHGVCICLHIGKHKVAAECTVSA